MADLLPGQLAYVFIVSIVDAAFLSWLVLGWYRRSVRRLMHEHTASTPSATASTTVPPAAGSAGSSAQRLAIRRVAVAYCVGAAVQSAVVTGLEHWLDSPSPAAVVWFGEWWRNLWPIVPTLIILLVLDVAASLRLAGVYIATGTVVLALMTLVGQALRGVLSTAPLTNAYWLTVAIVQTAWAPVILILVTGWRRIRAVTPLALAVTLLFGFSLIAFSEVFIRAFNLRPLRTAVLDLTMVSSFQTTYYGLFMVAALPVGWVAWRVVRALAAGFDRKRFSDVQLIIDCWWLIATAEEVAVTLAFLYGVGAIAGGLVAFIAYRLTTAIVMGRASLRVTVPPKRLLLLRVFGYQARTESLFDRVVQWWRVRGPVQLVAGVDLAMRTADPGDLLRLLNGRLADAYVITKEGVSARLDHLDLQPDPDGRFRVNEVYCHDDAWQPTLLRLLDLSDIVLMDLRSFRHGNAGCIFELEQLTRRVPAERIVFVYDHTTDLQLLTSVLAEARERARADGQGIGPADVALVRVERHSRSELAVLKRQLSSYGVPSSAVASH